MQWFNVVQSALEHTPEVPPIFGSFCVVEDEEKVQYLDYDNKSKPPVMVEQ